MLQNGQMALDFLRYKKIKLVNIRAEDIVDGNPKLTLGLIWTIILHFQVSLVNMLELAAGRQYNQVSRRKHLILDYLYHKVNVTYHKVELNRHYVNNVVVFGVWIVGTFSRIFGNIIKNYALLFWQSI